MEKYKKYMCYWGHDFNVAEVREETSSFFMENTGYTPEEIQEINDLSMGETFISKVFPSHIITCIVEVAE